MPKSTKFATTCACACAWLSPPITPNDTHGLPSFSIIAGTSVCSGRLRGPIWFGWPGVEREAGAAVVQRDAGLAGDDAGAEAAEQRLDERDDVALAVGGGHVDGVAAIAAGEIALGRAPLPRPHAGA